MDYYSKTMFARYQLMTHIWAIHRPANDSLCAIWHFVNRKVSLKAGRRNYIQNRRVLATQFLLHLFTARTNQPNHCIRNRVNPHNKGDLLDNNWCMYAGIVYLLLIFIHFQMGIVTMIHISRKIGWLSSCIFITNEIIQRNWKWEYPSQHDTSKQCWFNVGPASQTLD